MNCSLDVLALTETWHTASDDERIHLATPAGYTVAEVARPFGRGGGVAIVYRKQLKCSRISQPSRVTMEVLCVRPTSTNGLIVMLNVYRPGSAQQRRPTALFFDELTSILWVYIIFTFVSRRYLR